MADHPRDRLTLSSSSFSSEVSDDRSANRDSHGKHCSSRVNPFNSFQVNRSSPVMEEGLQSFRDNFYLPARSSRRHCHKPLDTLSRVAARRQLLGVTILCLLFMVIEAIGGVLANSLALVSDALHYGSDLINLLVCLLAHWYATKPPTQKMTFGYHRAEILGAFFSAIFIWVVSGVLCYIAADGIIHGHYKQVKPDEMLVTAALALSFNIIMGVLLHADSCCGDIQAHGLLGLAHADSSKQSKIPQDNIKTGVASLDEEIGNTQKSGKENDKAANTEKQSTRPRNINVRAAFIHVVAGTIQSLGVLLSALVIKFSPSQDYKLADPICTLLLSLLLPITTLAMLRDILAVFMEGVPRGMAFAALKKDLSALGDVVTVHSLHIWALTLDRTAVNVHLVIEHLHLHNEVLKSAIRLIQDKHHAHFCTVQVELYDEAMTSCEDCLRFNQ